MNTVYLAFLVIGLVLGVFAMLYGTERPVSTKQIPHERLTEHDPASEPSPIFNLASMSALIFAIGLSGYVLTRTSRLSAWPIAGIAGTIGAIVFTMQALLIARWAIPGARADQVDERYLLQGTIGTVMAHIPEGGEGSIRYVLEGREYVLPARNFEKGSIPAGTDIVVERIERGVAFVELWTRVEQRL